MGNHRFRLSDMIPNAWFYKLKDMGKPRNPHKTLNPTKKTHTPSSSLSSSASSSLSSAPTQPSKIVLQPHLSAQRKSYYFTSNLNSPIKTRISDKNFPIEQPRKSSRRRRSTKRNRTQQQPTVVSSSISAGCSCRATLESVWTKAPDSNPEEYPNSSSLDDQTSSSEQDSVLPECGSFDGVLSWSTSCKCKPENDIVIDVGDHDNKPFNGGADSVSELDHRLPPIITKHEPTKIQRTSAEFSERNAYGSLSVKVVKEDFLNSSPVRRYSNSSSTGVRLRTNSPKIAGRRVHGGGRKSMSSGSRRCSVSESFAVVKSSKDPGRDFRESMVEMIVENNIRASKDLEELLACYLSLNSDEYHDLIIKVFKQIWFDFVHVRLK